MKRTVKVISMALTKEDLRLLERACEIAGETQTDILKRGLFLITKELQKDLEDERKPNV